jgi:hypothetical protein
MYPDLSPLHKEVCMLARIGYPAQLKQRIDTNPYLIGIVNQSGVNLLELAILSNVKECIQFILRCMLADPRCENNIINALSRLENIALDADLYQIIQFKAYQQQCARGEKRKSDGEPDHEKRKKSKCI